MSYVKSKANRQYSQSARNEGSKKSVKKHKSRSRTRCAMCGGHPSVLISPDNKARYLCRYCDETFFDDLFSNEGKLERLRKGIKIANKTHIDIGFAVNVARGRYSLEEAKRRHRLKQREKNGMLVDIYSVGRRMPGSYQ